MAEHHYGFTHPIDGMPMNFKTPEAATEEAIDVYRRYTEIGEDWLLPDTIVITKHEAVIGVKRNGEVTTL